jgi:hypothetical protein
LTKTNSNAAYMGRLPNLHEWKQAVCNSRHQFTSCFCPSFHVSALYSCRLCIKQGKIFMWDVTVWTTKDIYRYVTIWTKMNRTLTWK